MIENYPQFWELFQRFYVQSGNRAMKMLSFSLYRQYSTVSSRIFNRISRTGYEGRHSLLNKFYQLKLLSTTCRLHEEEKNPYEVTFIKKTGERIKGRGKDGDSLLDVVVNNNLDFDGYGACEGTLTCSTCHVILKKEDYDRLPDKPLEEEMDMLDLAYELSDTSRLGCQIILKKELDGLEVQLPSTINDARS